MNILARGNIRIALVFVIAMHLCVLASAQQVSISGKDLPLKQVFAMIGKQTGLEIFCMESLLKNAHPVTLSVKDQPWEKVLSQCLEHQGLTWSLKNKTIIIKAASLPGAISPAIPSTAPVPSEHDISGRVVDTAGLPLPGATVRLKGTPIGVQTNVDGFFMLKEVSEDHPPLVVSFTGFIPREMAIPAGSGYTLIILRPSMDLLDQVQVIAYGSTTRRLNVGSVTTVKSEDIARQPVTNVLQALESNVPGLQITQSSGLAGTGFGVQIRGQNSIGNGNYPLFLVDGVQVQANADQYGANPFNNISPDNIESVNVLKDADATAIYGSRGANGVILITTKRGHPGETRVEANIYEGVNKYAHAPQLLNAQQYLEMRNEAFKNDGITPTPTNAFDLTGYGIGSDINYNSNLLKNLIGQPSHTSNVSLSVSGGNQFTTFLIGADYYRETAPMPGNFAYTRPSVHFNLTHSSADQRFRLSLSSNYGVTNGNVSVQDITSFMMYPANLPPQRNPDGSFNFVGSYANPYALLAQPSLTKNKNLIASANLSYRLLPGLELKTSFGYTDMGVNIMLLQPKSTYAPNSGLVSGFATYGSTSNNGWQIEPQLEYNHPLLKGKFSVLVGGTYQGNLTQGQTISESNFSSDALLKNPAAGGIATISPSYANYRYAAMFGRINYSYKDKYLLDLTARRDGSSRFGPGKQFGNFGAIGAGWVFSEENVIKNGFRFLSFGKLRGSYGSTGNDQIGDYKYLNTYRSTLSSSYLPLSYGGQSTFQPSQLFNPNYGWEVTRKGEVGLDLGFFTDRILFSVDRYNNRSSTQLVYATLAPTTGFSGLYTNLPATVGNMGWEFTLNTTNIRTKHFSWNSTINLTIPENKLLAYPGLVTSAYSNTYVIGQPLTIRKVYRYLGVDPHTGLYTFADKNGKPTATPIPVVDQQTLINVNRRYYANLTNHFHYKGLELSFDLFYVRQTGQDPTISGGAPGFSNNKPTAVLSRWQKDGDITNVEKFTESFSSPAYTAFVNATKSQRAYTSASYMRLKNVALSWSLNQQWVRRLHAQNARIYVNAQNLLTFTHYLGNDPEPANGFYNLPPLRSVVGGIQFTF